MMARAAPGSGAPARTADGSSRGSWWWVAAAGAGIAGGLANYLLAPGQTSPATPSGIRTAALLAAEIDLACWLLLGLAWLALLGPKRAGRSWAAVALTVTAGIAALLDLMNLVGSWATFAGAVAQLVLLAAALVTLYRPARWTY